jgi:hypothetical protein
VNSSAIPYCPPGKSVSKTQMSAACRDLDWSAASARPLFDGDVAILHNTVLTRSCRGHRSLSPRGSPLSVWPNPKSSTLNWRVFLSLLHRVSISLWVSHKVLRTLRYFWKKSEREILTWKQVRQGPPI